MKSITMTAEQTATYDAYDTDAHEMMADLKELAQHMADEAGETVEIYTNDGIVAEAVAPMTYKATTAIVREGDQYIGEFSVESAPSLFLKALVYDALRNGEARAKDDEGCEVTAVAAEGSN